MTRAVTSQYMPLLLSAYILVMFIVGEFKRSKADAINRETRQIEMRTAYKYGQTSIECLEQGTCPTLENYEDYLQWLKRKETAASWSGRNMAVGLRP
jgi:hypothetical protein